MKLTKNRNNTLTTIIQQKICPGKHVVAQQRCLTKSLF